MQTSAPQIQGAIAVISRNIKWIGKGKYHSLVAAIAVKMILPFHDAMSVLKPLLFAVDWRFCLPLQSSCRKLGFDAAGDVVRATTSTNASMSSFLSLEVNAEFVTGRYNIRSNTARARGHLSTSFSSVATIGFSCVIPRGASNPIDISSSLARCGSGSNTGKTQPYIMVSGDPSSKFSRRATLFLSLLSDSSCLANAWHLLLRCLTRRIVPSESSNLR